MQKHFSIPMTICLFVLTILLAACGNDPGNQPTTTATSTPKAVASPTQSASFVTYTGKGYTINYQPAWKTAEDGNDGTTFQDPAQTGTVLHVIVQTQSPMAALQIEEGTSLKDRCKRSGNLPATITINGVVWDQGQFICSSATADGSDQKVRTLEMQKPVGGTHYALTYIATPKNFDNAVNGAFQTMTESFKVQP